MKAFKRVVLLTAVLCLYGFISCGKVSIAASGNDTEQDKHVHNIQITGGYVVNCFGEVVTQARRGQDLQIITELHAGTYVSEWIVEGSHVYGDDFFTMPDYDVTITAVRKKQSPYTLDLRIGATVEGEKSYDNLHFAEYIMNAFLPDGSDKNLPYSDFEGYNVDVDGDGTIDFYFNILFARDSTSVSAFRKYGGSAHGDYQIEDLNNLPYWPVTIKFGEEPVKEFYSVSVTGGRAYNYDTEWNKKECSDAVLGETVYLSFTPNTETYLKYWEAEDFSVFQDWCDSYAPPYWHEDSGFSMLPADLKIYAVTGKKTPYTVDLRNGSVEVSNEVVLCSAEILNPEEFHYAYDQDFDLDKNGTTDVVLRNGKFYIASKTCSIRDSYTISGPNVGQYGPISFLFGDYQKEYNIAVQGGHAIDENGHIITSAGSGEHIFIVRDREEGKFFKAWNSDSNLRSNSFSFDFYMPAKNVNIFAETTSSQHELTVDLTEEWYHPTEEEEILLGVFFDVFDTMYPKEYRTFSYDLDRDGNFDVSFYDADYEDSDTLRSLRRELFYYSLGTRFSVSVNDGQIGTLTLLVDNSKAEHPVIDNSKSACSITAQGLKIFCYNPDDYDYSSYTDDKIISKAVPGTRLYIAPDYHSIPEGQYIIGFLVEGNGTSKEIYWDSDYYYMPDYDITISPITEEQTPLILDFTNGPARVMDGLGFDLAIYYTAGIGFSSAGDNVNAFFYDLNNDGQYEIRYNYMEHLAYFSGECSRVFAEIIYDNSEKRCEYWPLILRFSDKESYSFDMDFLLDDGKNMSDDVSLFIDSYEMYYSYRSLYVNDNYAPTIRLPEGTEICIKKWQDQSKYLLYDFLVQSENGNIILQYNEEELKKTWNSSAEIRFKMPSENVTVCGKLALKSVLMPSNTPTPKPSATLMPTDLPSVTETPAITDKPSSAKDSDDFHPFALLIAGLVLCMIGVGAYAVLYLKKNENNK